MKPSTRKQETHNFGDWRRGVKSMTLEHIYVVQLESFQALFDRVKYMLETMQLSSMSEHSCELLLTLRLNPC